MHSASECKSTSASTDRTHAVLAHKLIAAMAHELRVGLMASSMQMIVVSPPVQGRGSSISSRKEMAERRVANVAGISLLLA